MNTLAALDPAAPAARTPPAPQESAFHEILSELNPLQYLPVIGTLYRAVTGDTIPDTARTIGSLIVSGLMGGPVGVALNVAALAAEKATGIDPEKIGQTVIADIGLGPRAAPAAAIPIVAQLSGAPAPQSVPAHAVSDAPKAWSAAQLKSYGVITGSDGTLHHGAVSGADVLNDMELGRLHAAQGAG